MTTAVLWAVVAYLLGALPSDWVARRVPPAFATPARVALDVFKGALAVAWLPAGGLLAQTLAATAAMAGAQWPPWGGGGRRGLGVGAGSLIVLSPLAVPVWAVFGGLAYVITGFPTVGRVVGSVAAPLVVGWWAGWPLGLACLPICVMLLERDRGDLRRVLLGTGRRHVWRGDG